jgi:uncharacterized protein YcbK (DUF882 family)
MTESCGAASLGRTGWSPPSTSSASLIECSEPDGDRGEVQNLAQRRGAWERSHAVKLTALYQLTVCAVAVAATPVAAASSSSSPALVRSAGPKLRSSTPQQRPCGDEPRRTSGECKGAVRPVSQRLEMPRPERDEDKRKSSGDKARRISSTVAPIRHKVLAGETLGEIARRAGTTVEVLTAINSLGKRQSLAVGQLLVLPGVASSPRKSWHAYARLPKKKGFLDVSTHASRFSGQAMGPEGALRSDTVRALNRVLGASGSNPSIPERLVRLLVEVSDTFGGRHIRLVSGYRTTSYFEDSRHKSSSAIDFTVMGVPNAIVCEYLREIEDIGVGYYPNSSFVHLDVRDHSAYWVDYAGPGQPPRSTPNALPPRPSSRPVRAADRKLVAALDRILEETKRGLNGPRAPAPSVMATKRELEKPPLPTAAAEAEPDG